MRQEDFIRDGERAVDLQRSNLWLIQDPERFCFGMDAVLLSAYAEIKAGERCLDMGTGTGILPLLLSAKTDAAELVGLEIQPESADMASRSVAMNIALRGENAPENGAAGENRPVRGRVRIVQGDLREATALFGRSSFDVVTCNPPTGAHFCLLFLFRRYHQQIVFHMKLSVLKSIFGCHSLQHLLVFGPFPPP